MNINLDTFVQLFSAIGVSTIIGIVFNFVQSNKKDSLNFYIEENRKWREELKQCILGIKRNNNSDFVELETLLNPYGKDNSTKGSITYFMNDGHIWDLISSKGNTDILIFYLELLLKYNWDKLRSKIGYQVANMIFLIFRIILLLAGLYNIYMDSLVSDQLVKIILIILGTLSISLILLQNFVLESEIENPSRGDKNVIIIFSVCFIFPYIIIVFKSIYYLGLMKSKLTLGLILILVITIYIIEFYVLKRIYIDFEQKYIKKIEGIYFSNLDKNESYRDLTFAKNYLERLVYNASEDNPRNIKEKIQILYIQKQKKYKPKLKDGFSSLSKYHYSLCKLKKMIKK